MDNTGGDLVQAAKEVDVKIEKESQHDLDDAPIPLAQAMDEKHHQQNSGSSGASSTSDAPRKLDSTIVKVEDSKDDDAAYAHLPPNEREIVKKQLHIPGVSVTYWTLFRYATKLDLVIIFISAICAIAGGAALPLMTVRRQRIVLPLLLTNCCKGRIWRINSLFHGLL